MHRLPMVTSGGTVLIAAALYAVFILAELPPARFIAVMRSETGGQ